MARQVQAQRMSVKRKQPRKSVKKTVIRKGRFDTAGNNPSNTLTVRGYGFPDRLRTKLAYGQSFILSTTAVVPTPYKSYRMGSLYDPEAAVGGGQPYWFDQLATIYNRYKVLGAKITCNFSRTTETAGTVGPWLVGIQSADTATLTSVDAGVLASTANVSYDMLSQDGGNIVISQTYSPKKAFGDNVTDSVQARTNSDPGLNWFANVFASVQGVSTTTNINCLVTIEYFAEFFDQIQNAGS